MGLANLPDTVTSTDTTASGLVSGAKPNPPTDLTATLVATYLDSRGNEVGTVSLTWTDPTTNTDGSTLYLQGIYVQWKRTSATGWRHTTVLPGVGVFEVDDLRVGIEHQFRAYAMGGVNRRSVATATVTYTPASDGTAPSVPAAPTLLGTGQRGLKVSHDLTKAAGGALETDLDHLLVYLDTDSSVDIDANHLAGQINAGYAAITANKTVHGHFSTYGTTRTVRGTTYYCKVVPVDKAGNVQATPSAASAGVAAGTNTGAGPSQPTAPTMVGTGQRGLKVTHDLQKAAGGALESTLDHLLVYIDTIAGVVTDAAHLAGEIKATHGAITAGNGAHGHFNTAGTTPLIRGTTYYCKVVPVDDAGNSGTASAASSGVLAGAEAQAGPDAPPTATVTAIRSGIRCVWDLSTFGPSNLDVVQFHIYGGTSANPTTQIGERHISRDALAGGKTIRKDVPIEWAVTAGSTYHVRAKAVDAAGNESAYSAETDVAIAEIPGSELVAESVTGPKLGDGSVTALLTLSSGGTIRTSSAGQRVEITAADDDRITWYSGVAAAGLEDAYLYAGAGSPGVPQWKLTGAHTDALPVAAGLALIPSSAGLLYADGNLDLNGNNYPRSNGTFNLGTTDRGWGSVYVAGAIRSTGGNNLLTAAGDVTPISNGGADVGSTNLGYRNLYLTGDVMTTAGASVIDVSAYTFSAATGGRLVCSATAVALQTYSTSAGAWKPRMWAGTTQAVQISDREGTVKLSVIYSSTNSVRIFVGGSLKTISQHATTGSAGAGYRILRVPD